MSLDACPSSPIRILRAPGETCEEKSGQIRIATNALKTGTGNPRPLLESTLFVLSPNSCPDPPN